MNLRHLEVFCAVVERESFSGAAEKLFMTQPAVSMQVQALERHFGVQLLERRVRRMVLTESGQAVHRWALEVLRGEAETRRTIDQLLHAETGRIVVGASTTVGSYVLPSILSRFKKQHPGAEIVVRIAEREDLCADILGMSVDCAVLVGRQRPPGLEFEILGAEEMAYIAATTHPFANRKLVSVEELASEPFIMPPRGTSYRQHLDELLAGVGLDKVIVLMELDGAEGVKRGIHQGLGIGIAMRSGVEWELEHGLISEVRVPPPLPRVELALVHRERNSLSPMLRAFIEYLREQLREALTPTSETREEGHDERPRSGSAPGRAFRRVAHTR